MEIDLRVLELLSSKLCHDLVSPVSAINNGVELIEDIGGDVISEAMKLIGDSATLAARRLKVFRFAYGRAGSESNLSVRDIRPIAEQYAEKSKMKLVWPEDVPDPLFASRKGVLKTLINMMILAEEVLAYGGVVTLYRFEAPEEVGFRMEIMGRNAQLSEPFQEALSGKTDVEALTPRTIQSYVTGKTAAHFGLSLRFEMPIEDRLDFVLSAPAL